MDGHQIKQLREGTGLSRREFAQRAGLTEGVVRNAEKWASRVGARSERMILRSLALLPPMPIQTGDGARYVELSDGSLIVVDAADHDRITQYRWTALGRGYAGRFERDSSGRRRLILLHRVIMDEPEKLEVHHLDEDPANNRRSNLQAQTPTDHHDEHLRERQKRSGAYKERRFKGVYRRESGWQAGLRIAGEFIRFGVHSTEEEAAVVVDAAIVAYLGPDAWTNLIPSPITAE